VRQTFRTRAQRRVHDDEPARERGPRVLARPAHGRARRSSTLASTSWGLSGIHAKFWNTSDSSSQATSFSDEVSPCWPFRRPCLSSPRAKLRHFSHITLVSFPVWFECTTDRRNGRWTIGTLFPQIRLTWNERVGSQGIWHFLKASTPSNYFHQDPIALLSASFSEKIVERNKKHHVQPQPDETPSSHFFSIQPISLHPQ